MKSVYFYKTRIGKIMIAEEGEGICEVGLLPSEEDQNDSEYNQSEADVKETKMIAETARQLEEFLNGTRKEFDVKLNPRGTDFQHKVWNALRDIPYGETRSYKQIAKAIGNEKASRAVGMANHNNPIMIIVPCHRVIGANGKLVGYAGGLNIKEQLLNIERMRKEEINE